MSVRLAMIAAGLAAALAAGPASASFTLDLSGKAGDTTSPLSFVSGDNTVTFSSSPAGAFSVGSSGLFSAPGLATALGDYGSFSGDALTISFAKAVDGISFLAGVEDLGGKMDILTLTTNTGVTATLTTTAAGTFSTEGRGGIAAPGFTSVTITSANPFAINLISNVPEPLTLAVLGAGLAGLAAVRRRA